MSQQNQKGIGAIAIIIGLAVVVVLVIVGVSMLGGSGGNGNPDSNNTQGGSGATVDKPTYKLTLPEGWKEATKAPNSYTAELGKAVAEGGATHYYQDDKGNYLLVTVDPDGGGYEANETWNFKATGNRFVLDSQGVACTPGIASCTPAEANEYRIAIQTSGESGEHSYFFIAGNTKQKSISNLSIFKEIVDSVTVK